MWFRNLYIQKKYVGYPGSNNIYDWKIPDLITITIMTTFSEKGMDDLMAVWTTKSLYYSQTNKMILDICRLKYCGLGYYDVLCE